jgi:hypothetical protein
MQCLLQVSLDAAIYLAHHVSQSIPPNIPNRHLHSHQHSTTNTNTTMSNFTCYPPSNPKAQWLYCPSYAGAITFSALFGLTTLAHLVQAFYHRKPFTWVLIMGAAWEVIGYVTRTLSVRDQLNETFSTLQLVFIVLAPLWINAFVYMTFGRMVHCFLPEGEDRVFRIRARRIAMMFVLADVGAFIVQLSGAMMINSEMPVNVQKIGLKVYMAGVGVQLFFIFVFIGLAVKFQLMVREQISYSSTYHKGRFASVRTPALRLLITLYVVLGLIIFRNLYRLVEFSAGYESSITTHEWYTWVFDSVPMLLCLLAFNFFHPGRYLVGDRADFSQERRQRKAYKKARKQAKKDAKEKNVYDEEMARS